MAGQRTIVHDGVADLDALGTIPVRWPCPTCAAVCTFDAVAVVTGGVSIGWARSADVEALQDLVLAHLPMAAGTFDGAPTLRSAEDPSGEPYVAPLTCGACGMRCLAVVSYGEVQPARWRLAAEGLLPAPPGRSARHGEIGEHGTTCVLTAGNDTDRPRRAVVRAVDAGLCHSHTAMATVLVDGEPQAVRVDLRRQPLVETPLPPHGHVVVTVHLELVDATMCVRLGNLRVELDIA